jgi:hypothetical protein
MRPVERDHDPPEAGVDRDRDELGPGRLGAGRGRLSGGWGGERGEQCNREESMVHGEAA